MKQNLARWCVDRLKLVWAAWSRYQEDDGPAMAAAVAYYLGLSLFPLMLILIASLGWFLRHTATGQNAEQHILQAVSEHLSPTLETQVRQTLTLLRDRSGVNGPIGFVTILMTSLAAFSQFERAFDRIWTLPRPPAGLWRSIWRLVIQRGTAFLLLLLMGFFLVVIFATGVLLSALRSAVSAYLEAPEVLWQLLQGATTFVLNALLFMLIYRWLPKAPIEWSSAAQGGVLAAILWEAGRHLLAAFLIGTKYSSAYGIVGSFIAILLWCYYAVTVMLLGAEFTEVTGAAGGSRLPAEPGEAI